MRCLELNRGGKCSFLKLGLFSTRTSRIQMCKVSELMDSIMIGVTLGADSGEGWNTLLIVIVFHQFFEGAA